MATPADDESQFTSGGPKSNAKVRLAALAGRQWGRARYDQIRAIGVAHSTISAWRGVGYLYPELPRVYAVGHSGRTRESDLAAAVLYAGPGGMLNGATALWWYELLKFPPRQIFVATPRRVADLDNIVVRRERRIERLWHRGLPIVTPSQAILDFAATGPQRLLRFVLANADYHDLLDVRALQAISGRGIAGSAALNEALTIHLPALAHTRGTYEIVLLEFCETYDFPIPRTNVYVHGWLVDAHWPEHHLVVEIDDWRGHRTPAQLRSNHQRDLELRAHGIDTLRYAGEQLTGTPDAVATDLRRHLPRLAHSR
jgi:hypothetical protein